MLNPQQTAAVKYLDGPLLVLAGAGSGKTRVITQKIAYLLKECAYNPRGVFAVTFTNKAATEMQQRVGQVVSSEIRRGLTVATFHTLGLKILKKEISQLNLKPGFSIYDQEDSLKVIQNTLPKGLAQDKELLFAILHYISSWKNSMKSPKDIDSIAIGSAAEEAAVKVYPKYLEVLQSYNALDFDDLIVKPVELFRKNKEVLLRWQHRVKYLLVDEYQDSNVSQYELVKMLTGLCNKFTVVGDDDQSIYAWRGARPENLAKLQEDYPKLKVIMLMQNYRSTGRILQSANKLIANNKHIFTKKLWSELGHGELLRIMVCADEVREAEFVVADLLTDKLKKGNDFGEYAILYRGNHQSRGFEKYLRQHNIPYRVSGGQSWFAKSEVKDIFAYLKLLVNPLDDAAFMRIINVPKRGIGESSLKILSDYAHQRGDSLYNCAASMSMEELLTERPKLALANFKKWLRGISERLQSEPDMTKILREMVEDIGYEAYIYENTESPLQAERKMENVIELINWIGRLLEKDEDLKSVINKLILIDMLENNDENDFGKVQLMTLHASKGLEFPHVYLVGIEEDILPHRESIDADFIEEERRLLYVGITRAQKNLCISLCRKRKQRGELKDCTPSRFLDELPKENLEWFGKSDRQDHEQSKKFAKSHLDGLKSLLNNV